MYKLLSQFYWIHICCCVDGQKIAKRLAASITKETNTAKKLLEDYNIASSVVSVMYSLHYRWHPVPDSNFWQSLTVRNHCKEVPWNTQKDIMNAYIFIKRTEEELRLLDEVKSVLLYATQGV